MIGEKIGHYSVERRLGEGGMGIVYAARDEKLHRGVALKVLRPELTDPKLRDRFWREARAAAGLNHPGVCQVFEVGEHRGDPFIVMELLEGETLGERLQRGPLVTAEAVRVMVASLEVLGALHQRGLVHRDLKPSNLFILSDGRIKLLDFGLVLPIQLSGGGDGASLTMTGMVMGSPGYMAPEQIRGGVVDARADLFSLAAAMHEALTGTRPFPGASPLDAMYAVLHQTPPRLRGDREMEALGHILDRALAKAPDERYADATSMAAALRDRFATTPPSGSSSGGTMVDAPIRLAVLPFRMLRPDPELDFLGPSLADAIALSLAGLRSLVVRSTHAAARFAEGPPNFKEIATALDVDVILIGTLLPAGERSRVTAQLVEAPSGRVLWSQTADVSGRDALELQDVLTRRIVESLELPLTRRERVALDAQASSSPTAYEFFLRANRAAQVGKDLREALALYLKAIEHDPHFAAAWARLGRVHRIMGKYLFVEREASYAQAADALARSLAIQPDLPVAQHVMAQLDLDLNRAEVAVERLLGVVERNPNDPEGFAGLVTALRYIGMADESLAAHRRARALDPAIATSVMHTLYGLGQYEEALIQAPGLESDRALVLFEMGRREEALAEARYFAGAHQHRGNLVAYWAEVVAATIAQDSDKMLSFAYRFNDFPDPEGRYYVAEGLILSGNIEKGLEWLETALGVGYANMSRLRQSPLIAAVREDPRFVALFERAQRQHLAAVGTFGARVRKLLPG